jgi:hypothetical protein
MFQLGIDGYQKKNLLQGYEVDKSFSVKDVLTHLLLSP